jgi:CRISPR-associated protein Csx14
MSNPTPSISIPVDLTNPGQFFACCGFLELAARIDVDALGWFREDRFKVSVEPSDVLNHFFQCVVTVETPGSESSEALESGADDDAKLNPDRGRISPMRLHEPFNMLLDLWNDEEAQAQRLKTWTAGQRVTDLLLGFKQGKGSKAVYIPSMREHFAASVQKRPLDWLRAALPIEAPGSFSFDSRLSRNNALDLGHTKGGTFKFSPAVDVLTLIGLQRFRPLTVEDWSRNQYCTWREPVSVDIAAAAGLGLIPCLMDNCFEFPIKRRDSQGRFKLFGVAHPARRYHV